MDPFQKVRANACLPLLDQHGHGAFVSVRRELGSADIRHEHDVSVRCELGSNHEPSRRSNGDHQCCSMEFLKGSVSVSSFHFCFSCGNQNLVEGQQNDTACGTVNVNTWFPVIVLFLCFSFLFFFRSRLKKQLSKILQCPQVGN